MATVKHGHLTAAPHWWKQLRMVKRQFWTGERRAARDDAVRQAGLRPQAPTQSRVGCDNCSTM
jgi:hypothetical protein